MKKILILMFALFLSVNLVSAENFQDDKLSKIENSLIGYTSSDLDVQKRVERLEKELYGTVKNGKLNTRVDKLYDDLQLSVEKVAVDENKSDELSELQPLVDNNDVAKNENNDVYKKNSKDDYKLSKKISKYEKKIFNKNFSNLTDNERLSQLENSIFGKAFDNEDSETRLDRIVTVEKAQKSNSSYVENKLQKYLATGVQIASVVLMILAIVL